MSETGTEKQVGEPGKILIVDDNEELLGAISRLLEMQGHSTLTALSGEDALEIARKESPDLILLDWILPGIDGIEVCRKLKSEESTRGIMILLVTGRGSVDNRIEGLDAGADDFIPKPFKHPELLARIRSSLRLKKATDELTERNRQLVESQYELVRTEKIATIGLLASGIAHEFNNIMAGISGYAQLAKKNPKYMPQLVEVALTQAQRAQELTGSLSSYNRRADENPDCNVQEVIQNALCLVKKEIESNGIEIALDIEAVPHAAISAGQLQEVVLNLLINAIHAIGSRGKITLEVYAPGPDNLVEIRICDTGGGIPEENLNRIFDPFFTTRGRSVEASRKEPALGYRSATTSSSPAADELPWRAPKAWGAPSRSCFPCTNNPRSATMSRARRSPGASTASSSSTMKNRSGRCSAISSARRTLSAAAREKRLWRHANGNDSTSSYSTSA